MVEVANGFKMGVVKFIGETEFQSGEWIGVALERPVGECNGLCYGHAPTSLCFLSLYGLCRQTQWHIQRSEVFQMQGETRSICQT
jgi:dynactin complex subunit